MASVTYDHVTKRFNNTTALDDLNIHVPDKEFLVLVGPSGCGKSTALRCLAGLEEMTEGRILMDDRVINSEVPKDRDIAMVFQSYALYPHMTVYENMSYGLRLRKMPKDETDRRVRHAAQNLGIENFLNRRPKELSGGQRQRVAVGRAIVREPKVFLMDEPLSNLDAKLRVEARAMISRLHQQVETTFIYVTHDQVEAMTMGSRIAVLQGGKLQQLDTPQNLYARPDNMFVAGFIGSPAMNFFDSKLVGSLQEMYADHGSFKIRVPAQKTRSLAEYLGKDVILGIRPEDIHDRAFVPAGIAAAPLTARVDVTELMGSETYVYLIIGQRTFIARVDPRTEARPGHDLDVAMNTDNMHFFDRQTELAIR